jgi:potassium efflux system protein
MLRLRFLFALSAVALLAVPLQVTQAQERSQPEQAVDTARAAQPSAIPAAQIVVQGERTSAVLREIRSVVRPDPLIEELADRLPELVATGDELLADPASHDPEGLSRRARESVRHEWVRYKSRLDGWQERLTGRSQRLGREEERLGRERAVWEVTARVAREEGYPEAAAEEIASMLAAFDGVAAEIRSRIDVVLSLQNRVANLNREATDALARLGTAESKARLGLFTPESPPLWRVIASPGEGGSWAEVRRSLLENLRGLSEFWEDSADRLPIQGACLAIFLALVVGLRRRAKRWAEDDPELEESTRVFDRPLSVTILVLVLTLRIFHPQTPLIVTDLNRLLFLIPLLRLLPGLLHPEARRPLYFLAALWLVNELLSTLLPPASLSQRLGLLTVSTLALAGFGWFLRHPGPAAAGMRERLPRPVITIARLGAIALMGAIVANILGFVDLATLLTVATLASVLLALGLFVGIEVVIGLARLLLHTEFAQSLASVRRYPDLLIRRATGLAKLAALVAWAGLTLSWFDLLEPIVGVAEAVLRAPLSVGSLSISLGNILVFVLAVWLAAMASRLTRFVLEQDVFPRLALPRGVPGAVSKLSHYVVIGLGLMVAFAAAGIDLSSLALLAGALGVGIGFGLQAIVNNFVSGLILIFERPIQVDDTIELDTLKGTVKHIGIRASTVRTFDGAEVIVPNADLISGRVVNWTLSDRLRRIEVPVGVAYGTDPHRLKEILLEVARAQPKALERPEPFVLFQGFGESSLDFFLRFWTSDFENWLTIQSDATYAVHDALDAAGIEIPFPQRTLHIRSSGALPTAESGFPREGPAPP